MNNENIEYLLDIAKKCLERGEDNSNHNRVVDYRLSAYTIVNFYNVVLLNAGNKLELDVKEGHDISKKLFIISQELPELLEQFSSLIDNVVSIRNHIAHSDISIPKKRNLKTAINSAENFRVSVDRLITDKIRNRKKQKNLKEKYKEKTNFIRILLKSTLNDFRKIAAESEEFNKVLIQLQSFENINVDSLDNPSLRSLVLVVDNTIDEAEKVYEYIHSHCPSCGGELVLKTENKTVYKGPEDDPEPHYFDVNQIIKCTKCKKIIEREHITREYI